MAVVNTDLRDQVASELDLPTLDTSSTPTLAQVDVWLHEAAVFMCKMLPLPLLTSMQNLHFAAATNEMDLGAHDVLRIVSVVRGSKPCVMYDYADLLEVRHRAPLLHNVDRPACALIGASGDSKLVFEPTSNAMTYVTFVTTPGPVSGWDGISDEYNPPSSWSALLVQYAVMKGKYQDEEDQQYTLARQAWMEAVQIHAGGQTVDTEDS